LDRVDHAGVWALKRQALGLCHRAYCRQQLEGPGGPSARGAAFRAWRAAQGDALEAFATFSALREHRATLDGFPRPWAEWPAELRAPGTPAVAAFRRDHGEAVGFHAWLQWVAEEQLAAARARLAAAGMALGLYLDMALGVDPCGADAWVYQDVLALGASAGAPPDPFSLMGQRWGVPPAIPERHRASGYRLFRDTLRRNARRAAALRVDHALALWRLFWVPGGLPASQGAYVLERPEELLALVKVISREERCLVVGEDLGTIPPEVRLGLMASGFLSYRLLIFEKDREGRYLDPAAYPRQALVSVATHDLPTVDGFWLGRDLVVKQALGQYPSPEAERGDAEGRRRDRRRLLEALGRQGLLPPGLEPAPEVDPARLPDLAPAVHAYLARTPSAVMMVNLDDLVGETEMHNLPGTLDEHPNWVRKAPVALEDLPGVARARLVAEAIAAQGRGRRPDPHPAPGAALTPKEAP
ncbi:MAG: 4-alpha-glucanotransferase, partial [Deferrisomatales bacterium]